MSKLLFLWKKNGEKYKKRADRLERATPMKAKKKMYITLELV